MTDLTIAIGKIGGGIGEALVSLLKDSGPHITAWRKKKEYNEIIEKLKADRSHLDDIQTLTEKVEHGEFEIKEGSTLTKESIIETLNELLNEVSND